MRQEKKRSPPGFDKRLTPLKGHKHFEQSNTILSILPKTLEMLPLMYKIGQMTVRNFSCVLNLKSQISYLIFVASKLSTNAWKCKCHSSHDMVYITNNFHERCQEFSSQSPEHYSLKITKRMISEKSQKHLQCTAHMKLYQTHPVQRKTFLNFT